MSIARALTTVRRGRGASNEEPVAAPTPARAGTLRKTDFRYVDRAKISLPVTLLSTTNALAYDAPDLPKVNTMASPSSIMSPGTMISPSLSSSSSRRSFDGSESGASTATSISTPSFSREGSPVLDPNHLTGYFSKPMDKLFTESPQQTTFQEIEIPPTTPAVPTRALSHTKHTHQALARQRSQTRLSGENQSGASSRAVSGELHSSPLNELNDHPFGAELAQVMEVAEEFGVKEVAIWDEEEQFLMDHGLGRFSAEDYINDIQPLFGKAFYHNTPIANVATWL